MAEVSHRAPLTLLLHCDRTACLRNLTGVFARIYQVS